MSEYYINTSKGRRGPFTRAQLEAFYDSGRIPLSALVETADGQSIRLDALLESVAPLREAADVDERPRAPLRGASRQTKAGRRARSTSMRGRKKSKVGLVSLICLVTVTVIGVVVHQAREKTIQEHTDTSTQVGSDGYLATSDKVAEVRIPSHWTPLRNLNSDAVLQAGNFRKNEFLIVIRESKDGLPDSVPLPQYQDICQQFIEQGFKDPQLSPWRSV